MMKRKMLPLILSVILGLQGTVFAAGPVPEAVNGEIIEESVSAGDAAEEIGIDDAEGLAEEASDEMAGGEVLLDEPEGGELWSLEEEPVSPDGSAAMTEETGSLEEEQSVSLEPVSSEDALLEDGFGETAASEDTSAVLEETAPEEAASEGQIQEDASEDSEAMVGELFDDDDPASPGDEAYTRDKAAMVWRGYGTDFFTLEKLGRKYSYAYQVLEIVNQERAKEGLSPLKMNDELLKTAMLRSAECSVYFSHTRPNGSSCFSACSEMWGENIAAGYGSPASVMNGWMNSAGHRSNILGEYYTTIGIGCVMRNGSLYWVQCFGTGLDTANCSKPADRYVNEEIEVAESFTVDDGYGGESSVGFSLTCTVPETVIAGMSQPVSASLRRTVDGYTTTFPVMASALTVTSSNTAVLTAGSGSVRGVRAGTANVTVAGRNRLIGSTRKVTVVEPPKQPKLVAAYNGVNGIGIKFIAVGDATEYVIYRKYKGVWSEIRTISASSPELQKNGSGLMYTDTSVKYNYGEGYIYSVAAKRGSLVSTYDTKGSAIYRLNPPQNPIGVKAGDGKARISWGKVPCLGYEVQYYETGLSTQNWVKCPQTASLAQTISGLKKGKGYGFRIRCYKTNKDRGTYYSEYTRTFYVKV